MARMRFAKVQFDSRADCSKALYGLMQRGRVVALRDYVFIVPEPALEWLTSENVSYQHLQWLTQDDVVQTLRDSLAHPV
jgi:hypothetical protein